MSPQRNDILNKKLILIFIVLISIVLIIGGVYLKMKNDKQKEQEEKYYDKQKERITLYMKYNVKDFKAIKFTEIKKNPMDGYAIIGYINNDKGKIFTAHIGQFDNYQFEDVLSTSSELESMMKSKEKSVSVIKKEQSKNWTNKNWLHHFS